MNNEKWYQVRMNWWVKVMLLLFTFNFSLFTSTAYAQVEIDDDDLDNQEEELTNVPEEDEITVTDKEGNEEFVDFPEAMTYNLDSLMNLYMSKTYLSTPDDCQMGSESPSYPDEVYIERLHRMPTVMEMPHNGIVQQFINRYTGRLRYSVSYMLGAANFYIPIFEEALEAYQLPLELKYLPIIESALTPKAVSRVGATGLWQFMLATGKHYGLEVNSLVDERRDPVKSSYAAAQYLRDLYKIFGDWTLVIAAYNCGPGNINKAIHRAGGEKDYWKLYPYLPAETRGYVPAFIAANYIMNYYCEHNICPMTSKLPEQTDTVVVNNDVHLRQIAEVMDLDIEMLRSLNPEFRHDIVPGKTKPYAIRMPLAETGRFIDMQDSIFSYHASELLTKRAVVDMDDTPTYSRSRSSYRSRNNGRRARNAGRGARGGTSAGRTVTVRKGDTLSQIARRNGTTVAKIRQLNGIKGNNIVAGRKIRVR